MVLAAPLSARLGCAPAETPSGSRICWRASACRSRRRASDPDALLARMRLDKKNIGGRLRLILWRGIGKAEIARGRRRNIGPQRARGAIGGASTATFAADARASRLTRAT